MVNVDKAVIARLNVKGNHFEVLVDCDMAIALRNGHDVDMKDVLAADEVFTDSKKGMEASSTVLKQAFGLDNPTDIAKEIIKKGEIQLTAEYRSNLREEKRKRIVAIIQKNGVDPSTDSPHPLTRIEAAIEDAKVQIDEYKPAEEQVNDVLKKLRSILPIRFETKKIEVVIPGKYSGKAYSLLKSYGKLIKNEWHPNGDFYAVIELPGGLEEEFYDQLNSMTHGDNTTKKLDK